jgi:hypothetical protein
MTWWPGWDSIANTGWWSHFWFWFGIACLFALGASEIVSHVYGLRKDELVAAAESAANTQRQADADAAETRRKEDVAGLQEKLSEADKRVNELQKRQLPRRLSESQKAALITALASQRGQTIKLNAAAGDAEANTFGSDFVAVFTAAGIEHKNGPQDIAQVLTTPPIVGIQIRVSAADVRMGTVPSVLDPFMKALVQAGIIKENTAQMDTTGVPDGTIAMFIGSKP